MTDQPTCTDVAEAFARVAKERGHETAILGSQSATSFVELEGWAGGISTGLQREASPGPVLVVADHGAGLAAATLGALYAGRCSVPVDPTTPAEGLARIARTVGATATITALRAGPLDRVDGIDLARTPAGQTAPTPAPAATTWSISLTSGSTGEPKAVPRSPASLLRSVADRDGPVPLQPDDHVGLILSPAPVTRVKLLTSLLNGIPVSCLELGTASGIQGVMERIHHEEVSFLHLVPTLLRRLVETVPPGTVLESLRVVRCGGEALLWNDVARSREVLPASCVFVHTYGSSEAGGISARVVHADEPIGTGVVPVGHPVHGSHVWIEDATGQPAAPGETGQIVVEGVHLSQGYTGRPHEDDRFERLADGSVRYRTGDLGRLNDNEELEHLGRLDRMVKIGGARVDPAQVEDTLQRLPGVRDVVVAPERDEREDVHLVAHVMVDIERTPTPRILRHGALDHLPSSWVPARFVLRTSPFPLLASGKVDLAALRNSDDDAAIRDVPWASPDSELEQEIAQAMADALDAPEMGATDDFFLLGGDSLRAARMAAILHRRTGVDLPLASLLEASTPAQLARWVNAGGTRDWRCVVPVRPEGAATPVFVAHGRSGNVLNARTLAGRLRSGRPVYGIQAETLDGRPPRHRSLVDMAARYAAEVVATRPQGPYLLFGFSFGGWLALEMARQLRVAGHEVPLVILGDTVIPPHMRHDPDPASRTWRDRVALHRSNLHHGDRGWLQYLGWRLRTRSRRALDDVLLQLWSRRNRPLPPRLRPHAVERVCTAALAHHQQGPYDGRVVLLRAPSPDPEPDRGWSGLLGTPVEVVDVPGTHDRILHEPPVAEAVERAIAQSLGTQESAGTTALRESAGGGRT